MSDFPSSIYSPRAIENRPGVVYDPDDTKTFFAEDLENANNEIVAIENALGENLGNIALNGWRAIATIPTRQASDDPVYTLRFGADMTALLAVGQRIKFTQNGTTRYFIVVSVGGYSGGNTDVDVYGGTDYDVADTSSYAISDIFFSVMKAPFGFPLDPAKWTYEYTNNGSDSTQSNPTQNQYYNPGSISIAIPKGCWRIEIMCELRAARASAGSLGVYAGLSTANNSLSWGASRINAYNPSTTAMYLTLSRFLRLNLAAKTTYYLVICATEASATIIGFSNSNSDTIIRAVCAYL